MSFVEPRRDVFGTQRKAMEVDNHEDVLEVNRGEEGSQIKAYSPKGSKGKEGEKGENGWGKQRGDKGNGKDSNAKGRREWRASSRLQAKVHDETKNHLHPGPESNDCRSLLKAGEIALHANRTSHASEDCACTWLHVHTIATDKKVFPRSTSCLLALSLLCFDDEVSARFVEAS